MGKTLSAETLKLLDEADAILAKALDEVRAKLRNAPDDLPNGFVRAAIARASWRAPAVRGGSAGKRAAAIR